MLKTKAFEWHKHFRNGCEEVEGDLSVQNFFVPPLSTPATFGAGHFLPKPLKKHLKLEVF